MSDDERFNSYFYDGTTVLKNKLGILSSSELSKEERKIAIEKMVLLYFCPIVNECNKEELLNLHKFIFGDVYDFAGSFRDVDVRKVEGGDPFVSYKNIDSYLGEELSYANERVKEIYSRGEYAWFLADFYNALIVIHPFREGNGRTIREFLREFVEAKNKYMNVSYELDFTMMDPDNLMNGTKNRLIYPGMLEREFDKALKIKNVKMR